MKTEEKERLKINVVAAEGQTQPNKGNMLKEKLVKRLEKFLAENEMLGTAATAEQIAEAEKILNVKFPTAYVDFITRFGGTYAGVAIHAFENASEIGNETVIELTQNMRQAFGNGDKRQKEAQQSIAFSDDGSGNPILLNSKGEVVIFYHDCDEREVLASNLGKFIEDNFEEW
ncbi:MAG: SMI1/KNR4 family protein [Helicobacteraceae bacterium]|jgi:cell wall assembly regulator SMI1|nr:SMI1/KNR4 family protein [Helicobacteraceae bacterium]